MPISANVRKYGSLTVSKGRLVRLPERYAIEQSLARAQTGNELYLLLAVVVIMLCLSKSYRHFLPSSSYSGCKSELLSFL